MATPPRLVRLRCPSCCRTHWVIDSDYRGAALRGQAELRYDERSYSCPHCGRAGVGFKVDMKTPVSLTLKAEWLFECLARVLKARRG